MGALSNESTNSSLLQYGGHLQGNGMSFGCHLSIKQFTIMPNIETFSEYIRDTSKGCWGNQFKQIVIPSFIDTTD
jgi:hypothetical protein